MNFSVYRNDIFKALQKVINVIPSKSTIDILYSVLVSVNDNKLTITATDLEITQISWCNCKADQNGQIVIPGKLLADILREMPETELSFDIDANHKILVKSNFGEYKLSGQNKNDFPSSPVIENENSIQINSGDLRRMVEKTIFACATDNLRPALSGVYFQIKTDFVRMVSTDGHRLVKITNNNYKNPGFEKDVVIPTRALNLVARNLPEDTEQEIIFGNNHILFNFSDTQIYSRIIGEPYPDYERVIPLNNSKELIVNRENFISSIKRVSLFSNPLSNQVKLNIASNEVNVFAQDIDFGGEAHEKIECIFDAEEIVIAYNAGYLLDILRHIDTEKVSILLETPDGAGLIYPKDQEEKEELLMLVMPVRLNN